MSLGADQVMGGDNADEYLWHFKQYLEWTPTEKAIDPTDGLQALLINYTSMNNEDIKTTLRDNQNYILSV